jgi:hypothetical protein
MNRVPLADEEKGECNTMVQGQESHVTQSMHNGASLHDDVARQTSVDSSLADASTARNSVAVSDEMVASST